MDWLRIERMGEDVQGVTLRGDPRTRPEPLHFRVAFPGGDVDVVRCDDGSYWVHVRVNRAEDGNVVACDDVPGRFLAGRLDVRTKSASETDYGDFEHPDLYHAAVRIGRRKEE